MDTTFSITGATFPEADTETATGAGAPSMDSATISKAFLLYRQAEKLKVTATHTMQLATGAKTMSDATYSAHLIYIQEIRNELVEAVTLLAEEIDAFIRDNSPLEAPLLTARKHDVVREVSYLCTVVDINGGVAIGKLQTATTWLCPTISKAEIPPGIERNPHAAELSCIAEGFRMVWGLPNGNKTTDVPSKFSLFSITAKIRELPVEKRCEQLIKKYNTLLMYWRYYGPIFRDGLDSLLEGRARVNFIIKTEGSLRDSTSFLEQIKAHEEIYALLEHYKNQLLEITKEFLAVRLREVPLSTSAAEAKEAEAKEASSAKDPQLASIEAPYQHLCQILVRMQTHAAIFKERLDRLKTNLGIPLS